MSLWRFACDPTQELAQKHPQYRFQTMTSARKIGCSVHSSCNTDAIAASAMPDRNGSVMFGITGVTE
jgi:hypothetical protein